MVNNYEYLNDREFLKYFDELRIKEQQVKITLLSWDEREKKDITGKVLSGNINIDGNSSVRRTANLTMTLDSLASSLTNTQNLITINSKIRLAIGFNNNTKYYTNHPIIWFPMGIFIVTQFSSSHSSSGITISLQLKDKMCLLNGDVGGTLPASVNFGEIESYDEEGQVIISKPLVYTIIQEAVNHWGGEQLGKIIISDIDTQIKKVMRWVGDTPLWRYKQKSGSKVAEGWELTTDESVITEGLANNTIIQPDETSGEKGKYEYGDDVGYIMSDFFYSAGDLIGNAGDSITSVLDKIKNFLGNFEYFYDVDGNFRFQEIKNYLNTSKSTVDIKNLNAGDYTIDPSKGDSVYNFSDSTLITSYSNSPQFTMIKNDFIVWGIKETAAGLKIPVRYHLAIDKKPSIGNKYTVFKYLDPEDEIEKAKTMLEIAQYASLPRKGTIGVFYYVTEDSDKKGIYKWTGLEYELIKDAKPTVVTTKDWRTELYLQGVSGEPFGTDSNYYYTELVNEWPKIYNIWGNNPGFREEYVRTPSNLDFFLDFIDSKSAISEFTIENIGRRTKVINDDKVNCLYAPKIPEWIIIESDQPDTSDKRTDAIARGLDFIQVDTTIYSLLATGGTANPAIDYIRDLLYQHTSYNESISIQAIPIYYLNPNARISVSDVESGIYGDYVIKSISIPLDINGTMSISAIKALDKI